MESDTDTPVSLLRCEHRVPNARKYVPSRSRRYGDAPDYGQSPIDFPRHTRTIAAMTPTTPSPSLGDRSLFSKLRPVAYLNHAAVSPLSDPVLTTLTTVATSYAQRGLHAIGHWIEDRETLREELCQFIGAAQGTIGFVANTTSGVSAIAQCFPWQAGDRVVLFQGEFPANVTPWQRACELHQLRPTFLPLTDFSLPGGADLSALELNLKRGGVKLVATSAVQFQTGLRMPLAALSKLCHRHGAQLFVDGIQAVGMVDMDVERLGIDYLACGSHKWLMAPEGCAFLYAAPHRRPHLRPVTAGWLSHGPGGLDFLFRGEGMLRYDRGFKPDMSFIEGGAPNTLGLAGLRTALGLIRAFPSGAIFAHATSYLDRLEAALVTRGFESLRTADQARRSGILSTKPPGHTDTLAAAAALNAAGISVSTPDGHLRFAPHWPNHEAEIASILDAVDAHLEQASA